MSLNRDFQITIHFQLHHLYFDTLLCRGALLGQVYYHNTWLYLRRINKMLCAVLCVQTLHFSGRIITLSIETVLFLIALGSIVSVVAGALGTGGGGIFVPAFTSMFLLMGHDKESVVHLALGTSMASIMFTSAISAFSHHKKRGVSWSAVKAMAIGVLCGTFLATFIASHLSSLALAIFFSIFMFIIAMQMLFNSVPKPNRTLPGAAGLTTAGGIIGSISALVSLGGGALTVPFLVWCNMPLKKAIGTSAAMGLPISIAGTIGYTINGWHNTSANELIFGFVYLPAVIIISLTSMIFIPLGVNLAYRLPVTTLKKAFAFLLIGLSVKMLSSIA